MEPFPVLVTVRIMGGQHGDGLNEFASDCRCAVVLRKMKRDAIQYPAAEAADAGECQFYLYNAVFMP